MTTYIVYYSPRESLAGTDFIFALIDVNNTLNKSDDIIFFSFSSSGTDFLENYYNMHIYCFF